jgi:hypothetical protein
LIKHCLKVDPKATPKNQRLRHFSPDKREAIKKELAKLLAAGFIKEVYHPERLANLVLFLKNNNNEWRMCVDYTNLNMHCPKDPFALPRIELSTQWLAASCSLSLTATRATIRLLSRKKTKSRQRSSPHFGHMLTKLSFRLKNAGATYQRAIQFCLANKLHRNVEACVADVVVETRNRDEFISDLEETFNSLRKFRWKLNPIKCVFGILQGKLLRFIISHRGVEANLEKITAITDWGPHRRSMTSRSSQG